MRRTIIGLLSVSALVLSAPVASADSGALNNVAVVNDVAAATDHLTFDIHVEWSSCKAYYMGNPPVCAWFAQVRVQDADTDCVDPSAGDRLWSSATQQSPGVLDVSRSYRVDPGVRLTLCLWVKSITITDNNGYVALARAAVDAPALPPDPVVAPEPYSKADAKSVSLALVTQLDKHATNISVSCSGGLPATCKASWADPTHVWAGRFTLNAETATFDGARASISCVKHHRKGCTKPVSYSWGDGDTGPGSTAASTS